MNSRWTAPLSRRALLELGGVAAAASAVGLRPGVSHADPDPPPDTRKERRGGIFRVRLGEGPVHFDPQQTAASSTMIPLSFSHGRLVRFEAGVWAVGTQTVEADLADSWERQGDQAYVFNIRQGVRWHQKPPVNGRELTAEDVKYTYERFLGMKGNPNRPLLDMVDKVTVPSRSTVKFTLKEPNAWFLDRLASASTWIIARECVEKYGDLKSWESVVGTGPWMLQRYEPNAKLTYVRHPNYYRDFAGFPCADGVELIVERDPAAAFAAFAAGKYDFGPEYGMTVRRSDFESAKSRIRWLQTKEYLVPSGGPTAVMKLDHPPFNDVRVRRALVMAYNWREVLQANPLARGKGVPNPLVPAAFKKWSVPIEDLSPDGRKLYEANAGVARQLLAEAGHPGGIKFPVETTAGYGPEWMDAVRIVLKNWKAAGIEADLKLRDHDDFVSRATAGKFESVILAMPDGATNPDSYLAPLLPGELNPSGINDQKLAEMMKLQRRTADQKARRNIVYDLQRQFSQQAYSGCGVSASVVAAWMPYVKDFGPNIGDDYGGRLLHAWMSPR
jgi:peptide/nickel transport system substrate-binding protein